MRITVSITMIRSFFHMWKLNVFFVKWSSSCMVQFSLYHARSTTMVRFPAVFIHQTFSTLISLEPQEAFKFQWCEKGVYDRIVDFHISSTFKTRWIFFKIPCLRSMYVRINKTCWKIFILIFFFEIYWAFARNSWLKFDWKLLLKPLFLA